MDRQKVFDFTLKSILFLSPIFLFRTFKPSMARGMFFILSTFVLFGVSLGLKPKRLFSNKWVSLFLLLAFVRMFFDNGMMAGEWFNFWTACAGFIYVFCGVLLFYLVYSYTDLSNPKKYFKPIIAVAILNFLLVIAQACNYDFLWYNAPTISGFMENTSQLGQYSALSIPILCLFNPLLAIFPLITLIISKSISPILASVVGMGLFLTLKGVRKSIVVGVGILLVIWGSFNYSYIMGKWACRPIIWQKTMKAALNKPYLGHGYRSFNRVIIQTKEKGGLGGLEIARVHNDPLHTAQELGFPIVACIFMFLLSLFKKFKAAVKDLFLDNILLCLGISVFIILVNMTGQTLIRYASVATTFIILLSLLCAKIDDRRIDNVK